MNPARALYGLQRPLVMLRALGLEPDAAGMFTIPNDLPRTYKEALWALCNEFDDYDWRYESDAA